MAITRKQAEAVLAAVRARYKGYDDTDTIELIANWDGQGDWLIVWEDGPFEWAYRAAMGGVNEEVAAELAGEFITDNATVTRIATETAIEWPQGVLAEPFHSYSLGLYED